MYSYVIYIMLWTLCIMASHNQHSIATYTVMVAVMVVLMEVCIYVCVCSYVCVMPLGRPSFSSAFHKAARGTESS